MSLVQGKVKEIFQGEIASGRNQGDPFWSITLEESPDDKLTTFKEEFIEGLEQGKEYTFTVEQKGKYINIVGETVPCEDVGGDTRDETEEENPIVKPKPHLVKVKTKRKPPVVTSTVSDERYFKNRISALSASVDFLSDGTASPKEILNLADTFAEWINERK